MMVLLYTTWVLGQQLVHSQALTTYYSNTISSSYSNLPNGGVLLPGTYDFYAADPGWGDYSDQDVSVETTAGTLPSVVQHLMKRMSTMAGTLEPQHTESHSS